MNAPAFVATPPTVVTTTLFAPAVPAGVFALIDPAVALTMVAATPPIVTFAPARLAPAIVIAVPPPNGPDLGDTLAIVGTGT